MMLTEGAADLFRLTTDLNDDATAKLHPGLEKLYRNILRTVGYNGCRGNAIRNLLTEIKVGDRLVFDPFLNPQKSTGNMCASSAPRPARNQCLWETIREWAESGKERSPEIAWRNVRCLYSGFEDGGVGDAIYTIYSEKTII